MITMIEVICCTCGKTINKKLTEIKRQQKRGKTKFYCNKSCSGKQHNSHLDKYKSYFKNTKHTRQPDIYSNFRWYLKCVRQHSKKRGHTYDIDLDYLKNLWEIQQGICPFTKQKLELRTHTSTSTANPYSASLDRIDNTKGYIKGNVRFVALIFNYARNTFTDSDVIKFCQQVTERTQ